jgi:hypothetical protein
VSSSANTEEELRTLAHKLECEAQSLREAAVILEEMRKTGDYADRIKEAKRRAKEWMK